MVGLAAVLLVTILASGSDYVLRFLRRALAREPSMLPSDFDFAISDPNIL